MKREAFVLAGIFCWSKETPYSRNKDLML